MAQDPARLIKKLSEWSSDDIKTLRFRVRIAPSDACRGHTRTRGNRMIRGGC